MHTQAQPFTFPLSGQVRIALLEEGFLADPNMREFAVDDIAWLRSYAPEALVAPIDLALSLADRKSRGLFDLPSLSTAIVVLTSLDHSPLADDHRDLLWRTWGIPVFEQLRRDDGAIIARECEVHDGLHIAAPDEPLLHGRAGLEIVTGVCECGAETPRLRRAISSSRESGPIQMSQAAS
jgi:hypothetical protein